MKPLDILNPKTVGDLASLKEVFAQAKPFRHVVIDDFLEDAFARRLLAEFPAFEKGNNVGDDGRPGGKSTVERLRALGPSYARLDSAIQESEFLNFIGAVTSVDDLLYDPFYLGGGTHDNRNGQLLQAHIDFNYTPASAGIDG